MIWGDEGLTGMGIDYASGFNENGIVTQYLNTMQP